MHRTRTCLAVGLGLALSLGFLMARADEASVPPPGTEGLRLRVERLVQDVEGQLGVAARHLESGREMTLNGDVFFPLASVFKLPVLVELMAQVEEEHLSLDEEISLQVSDQHLGSGLISDLTVPGITLSLRNLSRLMMMISDNSATDIVLARVGADNVNSRLRFFGIDDIRVDRSCQRLIMDAVGLEADLYENKPLEEVLTAFAELEKNDPEAVIRAQRGFSSVLKDQGTPRAMNRLLEMIYRKEILDPAACEDILNLMAKCQTGESRIKGSLPVGTPVAHKTGTIGGTVNDVGIITLPHGRGHVALSVLSKDTTLKTAEIEKLIAEIARLAFDYFFFTAQLPAEH